MTWVAIIWLACFVIFAELAERAPELPWHD